MPLRDHFRPPAGNLASWEELHGQWPAMIVLALDRLLPAGYAAAPRVDLDAVVDIDVAAFAAAGRGGAAYEVRVYDVRQGRRLVAALEFVSPANKDRPENRRAFATRCAALLAQQAAVALIDVVTPRHFNRYADLLALLGHADPAVGADPPGLYAAACRRRPGAAPPWETWFAPLAVGQPLPTLPLWLANDLALPLELETTYEETCRILRIA